MFFFQLEKIVFSLVGLPLTQFNEANTRQVSWSG